MRRTGPTRRAMTLLETALAATIGAIALLACMSIFGAIERSERALSTRSRETNELMRAQIVLRRAMLRIAMDEAAAAAPQTDDPVDLDAPETARPRLLLETDASPELSDAGLSGQVQRFEMTLSDPPTSVIVVAQSQATAADEAAAIAQAEAIERSAEDAKADGLYRGAFELRPDGARERRMLMAGLELLEHVEVPRGANGEQGWTLWWRPLDADEIAGTAIPETRRLARAVPLIRGLRQARWQVFQGGERRELYAALEPRDLPAYVELELETLTGQYANWMFEVAWTVVADPAREEAEALQDEDGVGTGDGTGTGAGPGGGPGAGPGGGPGRGDRPGRGPRRLDGPQRGPERQLAPERRR